ncbi:lactoylglutathione lyase [Natranaerovirga hydrolytica]|uniref:Lactoylglutathione lyase n=1 Tax=Natranaerovirga hydrolytica TaxID=680378 RepID=A0A4R1M6V9_9FIRM|nr:VOC family protein [Natranaerovirga hydrolytica]TCK88016.1 lactoylglutathione lyase [Natranaerovirga hydrolytica]
MKFCWCTITVSNLEESVKFYEEIVGISVNKRLSIPNGEIIFLGDGETKIELVYNTENKGVQVGNNISLGFEVKSVEDKIDFVNKKGIKVEAGPIQPTPQIKFFFIKDPNGVKIQFVEHL